MAQRPDGNLVTGYGCLIVMGVGLSLFWASVSDPQVVRHVVGAGLAALLLYGATRWVRARPAPATLKHRLIAAVIGDLHRLALWTFLGMIAVQLIHALLFLSPSFFTPDEVASAQFWLYDFNRGLAQIASLRNVLLCLAAMVLLSLVVRAWWPVMAARAARKAVAAAVAFVGALAGFTFVAGEMAGTHRDEAVSSIRVAILQDLDRIAAARQEHAAFRWLAAELALERHEYPHAEAAWQEHIAARADQCRRREQEGGARCDPAAQILRDARRRVGGHAGLPPPRAGIEWLWDFRDALMLHIPDASGVPAEATYVALREELSSRPVLVRLRARAATMAAEADDARDAIRDLVVEGIAGLLGDSYANMAGTVADIMRDAMATALAAEADWRIRVWWRSRHRPIPRLFDADRVLVSLARRWRYQTIAPARAARAPRPVEDAARNGTGTGPDRPSAAGGAAVAGQPTASVPSSAVAPPMPVLAPPQQPILVYRPQPIILPPYTPPVRPPPVRGRFR